MSDDTPTEESTDGQLIAWTAAPERPRGVNPPEHVPQGPLPGVAGPRLLPGIDPDVGDPPLPPLTDAQAAGLPLNQELDDGSRGPAESPAPAPQPSPAPVSDVFLSHASEDKDEIARPLKHALEARNVTVWFDEIKIKVGHSIRQEIEAGIATCRFGVVIVSPHFFAKQWTNAELDALFGKKMDSGRNLVLPVWHHISKDEVTRNSPLLSGILALNSTTMTVDEMAEALAEVVHS